MQCVYCSNVYHLPHEFRNHMRTDHVTFNVQTTFAHCRYESVKADCTELTCRICSQPFDNLELAATHLASDHDLPIEFSVPFGVVPFKLETDKTNCYLCQKKFPGLRQLSRHITIHFPRYMCETCGKSYMSQASLRQHLKFAHRENKHICRKCCTQFNTISDYRKHFDESKKCWSHLCNLCGERFKGWHLKEQHLQQIHGRDEKKLTCPECGECFRSRKLMRIHFKFSHTDDVLTCTFCGQKFDYKSSLDCHLVVHTQEKQFPCSVCSKTFFRKKNLEQHMWVHRDVKRFGCITCDKKFNQRVSWRSHMKTHHPEQGIS